MFNDSGIRSVMVIDIITPPENDRDEHIILFLFFIFINIGIVPSKVARPAIRVSINAMVVLFILSPLKYM